jgi:hypothetical protein
MMLKIKHNKNKIFTDKEIEQYCQSVENLLAKINERSVSKKSKKTVKEKEDYMTSGKNNLVLS